METNQLGRLVLWTVGLAMFAFFWGWVVNEVQGSQLAYLAAPIVYLIFTWGWFSRWFLQPDKKQYNLGLRVGQKTTDSIWRNRVGKWLVWSNEHRAWWKSGHSGYTEDRNEAGRYTFEEACKIVRGANEYRKDKEFPFEAMVQE